jgi:hypothetical protein
MWLASVPSVFTSVIICQQAGSLSTSSPGAYSSPFLDDQTHSDIHDLYVDRCIAFDRGDRVLRYIGGFAIPAFRAWRGIHGFCQVVLDDSFSRYISRYRVWLRSLCNLLVNLLRCSVARCLMISKG